MTEGSQANNQLHIETWVDEHGDYLLRYALPRIQNADLAEELVQETFLAGIRSKDTFKGNSSERTWLVSILKHKIIDRIRKLARERAAGLVDLKDDVLDAQYNEVGHWKEDPQSWGETPGKLLERKEFFEALSSCFENLPEKLRLVFSLRVLENHSTEEVCKELDISPTNLWVILHRARGRLRKCLDLNWFQVSAEDDA